MADWDALTWWEQRLYRDGLVKEFSEDGGRGEDQVVFSGQRGEMSKVGFTEINLS